MKWLEAACHADIARAAKAAGHVGVILTANARAGTCRVDSEELWGEPLKTNFERATHIDRKRMVLAAQSHDMRDVLKQYPFNGGGTIPYLTADKIHEILKQHRRDQPTMLVTYTGSDRLERRVALLERAQVDQFIERLLGT
jgi:hypothetical protein